MIGGPPFETPSQGIELPDRSFSERFAVSSAHLAVEVESQGRNDDSAGRFAQASEYFDFLDSLTLRLKQLGRSPLEIITDDPDDLTAFLARMPVRWIGCRLRRVALRGTRTWQRNDLNDIVTLSVGSAQCDVVVFEKHWSRVLAQTGVETRARVVSSIRELPALLV